MNKSQDMNEIINNNIPRKAPAKQLFVVIILTILHHIVSDLTMTKIAEISTKIENDAFLFGTYVKQNIDNIILKEIL